MDSINISHALNSSRLRPINSERSRHQDADANNHEDAIVASGKHEMVEQDEIGPRAQYNQIPSTFIGQQAPQGRQRVPSNRGMSASSLAS